MKTVFSKALLALALLATLYSCSDDDNNGSIVDETNVVKNDAEAIALVNGAYANFRAFGSGYSFLVESATDGTISFEGEENENGPTISRFEIQPTNWYVARVYSVENLAIAAANDAIAKINESPNVSDETKKLAIARAKLIRGLAYHYLVQLFGEIPLNIESGSNNKSRASIDDVYTQIVKDLTDAEAGLPAYDSNPTIPSKGVANALLAKVYLTWGHKPLTQSQIAAIASSATDPAHAHVDNDKLNKAVEYANKVIDSGKYDLVSDFTKLYGRANESKAPEHIFTIGYDGVEAANHQTHCSFTFGFNIEKDNHIGPSNLEGFSNWDAADSRRDYSYTTKLNNPEDNKDYSFLPPVTLPRFGKFIDRTYTNSVNLCITTNDIDRIEIRYAEVLLIKAEALAYLGKFDDALDVINELRERAFGNKEHNLEALTIEDVHQEWRYEFVYEQKHWFNLVRWKNLISTVKSVENFEYFDASYATAGQTGKDGNTVNPFFAKVHKHLKAKYNNVRGKHYRFPIPTGESGEDLGITPQNPGY